MQRIKVIINRDGTLEYEVSGVKGKSCKDVTKFIDTLSDKTIETKNTGEYYQQGNPNQIQNKLGS